MNFELKIECDNAAFTSDTGGDPRPEIARILREAAKKVERMNPIDLVTSVGQSLALMDINGNTVGYATVKGKYADCDD